MSSASLRIAMLTHSTNARGGVIHALELADSLTRLGHEAVVHAPDRTGRGFFRQTLASTVSVPASATGHEVADMVETRVADYVTYFEDLLIAGSTFTTPRMASPAMRWQR